MLDTAKLLGQMVVAFLIVDLLKDGVKSLGRYAWGYACGLAAWAWMLVKG